MVFALFIPADGNQPVAYDEFHDLDDFQIAVGGYIEVIHLPDIQATLFVNEEGLHKRLPPNFRATEIWWTMANVPHLQVIFGNTLLLGEATEEGESQDLPSHLHTEIMLGTRFVVSFQSEEREGKWQTPMKTYPDYFAAIEAAARLQENFLDIGEVKVEAIEFKDPTS